MDWLQIIGIIGLGLLWNIYVSIKNVGQAINNIYEAIDHQNATTVDSIDNLVDSIGILKDGIREVELAVNSVGDNIEHVRKLAGYLDKYEHEEELLKITEK